MTEVLLALLSPPPMRFSMDKWDCIKCGKYTEGEGHGGRNTKVCRTCELEMVTKLYDLLGLQGPCWDEFGITLDWENVEKLLHRISYWHNGRMTVITDKARMVEGV